MTIFLTQCPNCKTSFRASVTQLESAEGKVRCGACLNIFVADDNLVPNLNIDKAQASHADAQDTKDADQQADHAVSNDEEAHSLEEDPDAENAFEQEQGSIFTLDMEDSLPGRINPAIGDSIDLDDEHAGDTASFNDEANDAPYDDADLHSGADFSGSTEQSRDIDSEPDFDATQIPSDHFSGNDIEPDAEYETAQTHTSFAMKTPFILQDDHDAKPSPNFTFSAIDDDQLYVDDADDSSTRHALSHDDIASLKSVNAPLELDWQENSLAGRASVLGVMAIIALCLTLAGQLAWLNRDALAQNPSARPLLEKGCALLKCGLSRLSNLDAITSDSLLVRSHDQYSDALSVNLIIRNDAAFAQAFPILLLRFTNPEDELVAERRLLPSEYLPTQLTQLGAIPPSSPVQVNFAILDPGLDAVNYEVSFALAEAL
jgi:predicted Zn finger-like uncharacterized protein